MSSISKLKLTLFLFIFAVTIPAGADEPADDATPHIKVCKFSRPEMAPKNLIAPKLKRVADVTLNGSPIPTYSMAIDDASTDNGYSTYTPNAESISLKPKPKDAKQFKAYGTPMGTIVVPASWTPRDAAVGADASFRIIFAPDTTGQTYLSLTSDGACFGCSKGDADMYFGHATQQEFDDEVLDCLKPSFVHTVTLNPHQVAYSITADKGNPIDGVAYMNNDENVMFYDMQVSLPKYQHALATQILNQFVIPKKTKAHKKHKAAP